MSIDATAGGSSSDSFISVADANSYFADRLHTDNWDDLDVTEKEKALKWATMIMNRMPWLGSLATDTQALRWPRNYVNDLDGNWYDEASIPAFIEQASCELAIELAASDRTTDNSAEQLKALAVGSIKLDFNQDYVKEIFPETVKEIIAHALANSATGIETMKVLRA